MNLPIYLENSVYFAIAWSLCLWFYLNSFVFCSLLFKIKIDEVTVGYPPSVLAYRVASLTLKIGLIPFGGFAKFPALFFENDDELYNQAEISEIEIQGQDYTHLQTEDLMVLKPLYVRFLSTFSCFIGLGLLFFLSAFLANPSNNTLDNINNCWAYFLKLIEYALGYLSYSDLEKMWESNSLIYNKLWFVTANLTLFQIMLNSIPLGVTNGKFLILILLNQKVLKQTNWLMAEIILLVCVFAYIFVLFVKVLLLSSFSIFTFFLSILMFMSFAVLTNLLVSWLIAIPFYLKIPKSYFK
jgi:hypothetical protein